MAAGPFGQFQSALAARGAGRSSPGPSQPRQALSDRVTLNRRSDRNCPWLRQPKGNASLLATASRRLRYPHEGRWSPRAAQRQGHPWAGRALTHSICPAGCRLAAPGLPPRAARAHEHTTRAGKLPSATSDRALLSSQGHHPDKSKPQLP